MGLWYGSEVITHIGSEEGESIYDTCVVIHLSDITNSTTSSESTTRDNGPEVRFGTSYGYPGDRSRHDSDGNRRYQAEQHQQHQYQYNYRQPTSLRYLRLIWDEKHHTLEYTLRFNSSRPGFWISSAAQSKTMTQLPNVQFTGTVQVLKAINNQLVLTFCQSVPGGQLFSVVLTRHPMGLSPEENQSIRNFLRRKHLSTTSMRKVCFSAATNQASLGMAASILIVLVLQFSAKMH